LKFSYQRDGKAGGEPLFFLHAKVFVNFTFPALERFLPQGLSEAIGILSEA